MNTSPAAIKEERTTPPSDTRETVFLDCDMAKPDNRLRAAWTFAAFLLIAGLALAAWLGSLEPPVGAAATFIPLACLVLALLFSLVSQRIIAIDSQTLRIGVKSLRGTRWKQVCRLDALRDAGIIATRNSDGDTDFAVRLRMDNGDTISLWEGVTRQSAETCLEAFERACGKRFGENLDNTPPPASAVPPVSAPIERGERLLQQLREQRGIYWVLLGLALLTAVLAGAWRFYGGEWLLVLAIFAGFIAVNAVSPVLNRLRAQKAVKAGHPEPVTARIYLYEPYAAAPKRRVSIPRDGQSRYYHAEIAGALGMWEFAFGPGNWEPTEGTFVAEAYFLDYSAGPVLVATAAGLLIPASKPRRTDR
jgi:hypothetical protein